MCLTMGRSSSTTKSFIADNHRGPSYLAANLVLRIGKIRFPKILSGLKVTQKRGPPWRKPKLGDIFGFSVARRKPCKSA